MRKIFLIPLFALMCSVTAWGATKEVNTRAKLTSAVNDAASGDVIKLTGDITLNADLEFLTDVTLDLNNKTLTCAGYQLIVDGLTLTITDNSTNKTGTITTSGYTCLYLGAYWVDPSVAPAKVILNNGKIISTAAKASEPLEKAAIYLGAGSEFVMNGGRVESKNNALCVYGGYGYEDGPYGIGKILSNTVIWSASATIAGGELISTGEECVGVVGNCGLDLGSKNAFPSTVNMTGGTITGSKHGVVVFGETATFNLSGTGAITATNGFGIAGNGKVGNGGQMVNTPSSFTDYGGTVVTVSGGSVTSTNAAGIYQPQNGTVTISGGAVTGKTGLAIKSGSLNVTGGTITANGEKNVTETGINNGIIQTGAAISIESNGAYAGNMNINISSEAKLVSAEGYAIYEYVAKSGDDTHVNTIAVTNGKFQGGICGSQSLTAKGGFVSGGKWSEDVTANVVRGKAANPISEHPYFFEVGDPTPETAEKDNTDGQNAVLVNADASSAEISDAQSEAGRESAVTTTATNSVVVTENTDVVVAGDKDIVEVKKVTVEGEAQLSVKEGATLMVGAGSVLLDENTTTGGLTVEAGAALVVEGLIYGSTEDNFVIEGQEDKSAIVLFSPETEFVREDHPKATYRFTSKSFRDESKWVYQRFGMPSVDGNVTIKSGNMDVNSYICTWDYEADAWGAWRKIESADGLVYTDAVPFQCYQLGSTNAKDAPVTYDFIVELTGNSNAALNFKTGWNPYSNSYTAPIDIKEFLNDVVANTGADIQATIYLYQDLGNDTYTWQGINLGNVGKTYRVREDGAMVKKEYKSSIEPMQAFIMKLSSGNDASTDINYLNNVYNPAMGIARPSGAPARNRAAINEMQIGVYNDMYWDNISVMEGEKFSADMDNGYDAVKYDHNKGVSLYVMNGTSRMERIATNDIEGTMIGINAPADGMYTLDFSGVSGEEFAIIDMTNNEVISIVEDGEYTFFTEAGNNDYRFQIVRQAKVPTGIENTNVNANIKGIYTLTGQFMGYDFNSVPAGVYVVNGAKVVK